MLIHAKAYSPESKAKIERSFRTVKDNFINLEDWSKYNNLKDLNEAYRNYIVKEYIIERCNLAEVSNEIFDESSIKALASNCNGSTRYLNNLIDKALMICCNQKEQTINTDTIMLATNDLSLI